MTDFVAITTTTETTAQAESIAQLLVKKRLAACVQLSPIHSIYRWQGSVESSREFRLVAKTRGELTQTVIDTIRANHSYEVPEITVTDIIDGSPEYLKWIETETRQE